MLITSMTKEDTVRYVFQLPDEELAFDIDTTGTGPQKDVDHPDWTLLSYHQCKCCPLDPQKVRHCPAATRIHHLLEAFADKTSIERVQVAVHTNRRTFHGDVDLQVGVNSLLGLLMATSGCPVLDPLKTMAQFHLPFCNTRETLFRTISAYLTQQYFVRKNGGDPDWGLKGLSDLYNRLETLNQDFSQRIQGLVQGDAMANAIVIFFATSVLVNASIEEQLQQEEAFLTGTSRDSSDD